MLNFTEETNEVLIGIRFNNNKEWYHANKNRYKLYVGDPIKELADRVFELMYTMDKNFTEKPKISRVNRDIRFSKNKNPYKECKWFFLRADGKPDLTYPRPTYFFEISPDWWRYGMFFFPKPSEMAAFRKKVETERARFSDLVNAFNREGFYSLEGEEYKRPMGDDLPEELRPWYQKKGILLVRTEDYMNMDFYKPGLEHLVFDGFKKLYPLYKFFDEVDF